MIGRKIYYDVLSGDVILIIPEKHNVKATNTTTEQDFQLYEVLHIRNPETIGVIQLDYGDMRRDFEIANSVKVDLESKELTFEYPIFEAPISQTITRLTLDNDELNNKNIILTKRLSQAEADNLTTLEALAEVYEMLLAMQS